MVHARTLDGEVLDFGHSGLLYRSSFLLYDHGTKSLWHHVHGRALTGRMRGKQLDPIPSQFVKWEVWKKSHPGTKVLAKDPTRVEHTRDPFRERNLELKLTFGLGILAGDEARLYEHSELEKSGVVLETVGGEPIVVLHHPPTATTVAWKRTVEERVLDLRRGEDGDDGLPRLEETGADRSVFHPVTGECLTGPLRGKHLDPVVASNWETYAWFAHHPDGTAFRASVPGPVDLPEVPEEEDGDER